MNMINEEKETKSVTKNMALDELDPITVEVVRNKFEGIANEMQSTLLRSSFSPIVKEGLDASASLFMLTGETLAQACAIPIHLATLIPIIKTILETYPLHTMQEGDVYIMNDPYLGGTHLPDIAIAMPIFHKGQVIAISAAMTHHQDVGGMTPGSIPTNATEIYQEGIRIPPLKLFEAGELNEPLVSMLRLNVRIPDIFMGDINAQVAACNIGARRMDELADVYGVEMLHAISQELVHRSEQMTVVALEEIPDGKYHYVDYLDNDGVELDKKVRIEVTTTIKGGTMHLDFTGTDPQLKGPFNCVPSGVQAAAYFALKVLTDPNIPTNAGCFRPVSFYLPEGSLVNPKEPAPVCSGTATIKRITGTILAAFKEILPEKVPADSAGVLLALAFGGQLQDGKQYVTGELIAGGAGASHVADGADVVDTDASNCMNLPAEAMEMEAPIRVHRISLRKNSGGPGKYRGGLGLVKEFELLGDTAVFTHRGERHYSAAQGSLGGSSGAKSETVIIRVDGTRKEVPSKMVTTLYKGDRVIVKTPGGGGHGSPKQRDYAQIAQDITDGRISKEVASKVYGMN